MKKSWIWIGLFWSSIGGAVQTDSFVDDEFEDFSMGDARGVAIDSDGYLKPGLSITKIADVPQSLVWSTVIHSNGTIYVAAGNEGQVFKVERDGKVSEFFRATEIQIQCLAIDSSKRIYAASMPEGKIYRMGDDGKSSVFFEPKEKYIWAMCFDRDQNLFVATGDRGKLFKVNPSGEGKVFYDSDETHIRTLCLDRENRLWAGTDSNGLVFRFDRLQESQGKGFVAYDSSLHEVSALTLAEDGSIFVGAMGDGLGGANGRSFLEKFKVQLQLRAGRSQRSESSVSPKAESQAAPSSGGISDFLGTPQGDGVGEGEVIRNGSSAGSVRDLEADLIGDRMQSGVIFGDREGSKGAGEEVGAGAKFGGDGEAKVGRGEIVQILPDGTIDRRWAGMANIFTLIVDHDRLFAGTDHKGRFMIFDLQKRTDSNLSGVEADVLNRFIRMNDDEWVVASSLPGALWKVQNGKSLLGTFESRIFDAQAHARWGRFEVTLTSNSRREGLQFFVRTGNSSKPDKVWNDWVEVQAGERVENPSARYLQYKVTYQNSEKAAWSVDLIAIFYQMYNQPPKLSDVKVLDPDIELVKRSKSDLEPLPRLNAALLGKTNGRNGKTMPTATSGDWSGSNSRGIAYDQVRKMGWRSAIWQASDPEGDELRFSVFFRSSDTFEWKSLETDLSDSFVAWDSARWAPGDYYLKVIASDAPSNLERESRTDEMVSHIFLVDFTPPVIDWVESEKSIKKGKLSIRISDTTHVVDEVEYSLDGIEWKPLLPVDRIFDAKSQRFEKQFEGLEKGDHVLTIRASDAADNVITESLKFRVD
jgi:hypothetical protein